MKVCAVTWHVRCSAKLLTSFLPVRHSHSCGSRGYGHRFRRWTCARTCSRFSIRPRSACAYLFTLMSLVPVLIVSINSPALRPSVAATKFRVSSAATKRSMPTAPMGMSSSAAPPAVLATTERGTRVSSAASSPAKRWLCREAWSSELVTSNAKGGDRWFPYIYWSVYVNSLKVALWK